MKNNGRLARMLASLMVLQTELPPLGFDILRGKKKQEYFFYFFLRGGMGEFLYDLDDAFPSRIIIFRLREITYPKSAS